MGEFTTVLQTLDFISGLHNCLEFSQQPPITFISCYANMENVFYWFNNTTGEGGYFNKFWVGMSQGDTRTLSLYQTGILIVRAALKYRLNGALNRIPVKTKKSLTYILMSL